jgi:RNA polymerase sigma factor (sigma-70 family)
VTPSFSPRRNVVETADSSGQMDDSARFRELFEAAFGAVRRYVHHRGVTGGAADDVVAETFLVAWRRLDDVPQDDPLPWLLAVARNVWLNQRRADRRRQAFVRRLPPPALVPPPAEPADPSDTTAVRAALAWLGEGDREILRLVAWDELTSAQVAEVLGCTAGAARVRLHRARQRLAEEMEKRSWGFGQEPDETPPIREVSDDRT